MHANPLVSAGYMRTISNPSRSQRIGLPARFHPDLTFAPASAWSPASHIENLQPLSAALVSHGDYLGHKQYANQQTAPHGA